MLNTYPFLTQSLKNVIYVVILNCKIFTNVKNKFLNYENAREKIPKAPISLAWRLVGDLLATRVSVGREDVAATSPGGLAGREGVAVKSNMFDFFLRLFGDLFKSPVGLGDVAATKYVFEEEDVSETCSRPNDCGKVATPSPQRRGDVSATRRRRLRDDD